MLTPQEINDLYIRAQSLVKIGLPDKLWEGGVSTFKVSIDQIRSNQEQLSTMMLAVSREHLLLKRLLRSIKSLLVVGVFFQDVRWPEGYPNLLSVEDREQELAVLWDNLKLMHSELSRARSDLRSKIYLLEAEARMGPSGLIPSEGAPSKSASVGVHSAGTEHDFTWDTLTDDPNTPKEKG